MFLDLLQFLKARTLDSVSAHLFPIRSFWPCFVYRCVSCWGRETSSMYVEMSMRVAKGTFCCNFTDLCGCGFEEEANSRTASVRLRTLLCDTEQFVEGA